MADIQIETHDTSIKPVAQALPNAGPLFDDDEPYVDPDEVVKANSERSEKTLSIEEEEAQEEQSKNMLPSDKKELTPNTSSTKELSKSVAEAPEIIDLTAFEEEKKEADEAVDDQKNQEVEKSNEEEKIEPKTQDTQPLELEKAKEEGTTSKPKRKSKRASTSKRSSSKPRKSKSTTSKSEQGSENKEKSPKKKSSKRKSTRKITEESNPVESSGAGEPSRPPVAKTESPPVNKTMEPQKTVKETPAVPSTPTKQKQTKTVNKKSSPKAKVDPDDFLRRKAAKEARADELRNYLSAQGDTLMVEPRSDDSVSFLTIPQAIRGDANHHVDLNKLPQHHPPRTVNPMISMGDDGDLEPQERRISYDLEALMNHQGPPKPKQNKWENVSVITDDVETVLGENDKAEIVIDESNKVGHDSRNTNEFEDVDLEQPSKEAAVAVDEKSESRVTVATIVEDLQNMMIRRPISASVLFVFLVATLVFLGIALMQ